MKKVDVNFKIFSGFIAISLICIGLAIYYFFDIDIDFDFYFITLWVLCSIIGFCVGMIFIEKDPVGLYDKPFGILLAISGIVLIFLIYINSI